MQDFNLNIRLDKRNFFMMNMVKHWHRWPIETVDALSLEPFNIKLENSVADIPPLIAGGLD